MKVGPDVMIAYVPDMAYFAQLLGLPSELPPRGEQVRASAIHITAEQLDAALKASKDRPEIVR